MQRVAAWVHWLVQEVATTQLPPLHTWPCAQDGFKTQSVQPLPSVLHSTTEPLLLHCLAPAVHWLEQVATQPPPLQSRPPAQALAVPKARQPVAALSAQVRTPPVSHFGRAKSPWWSALLPASTRAAVRAKCGAVMEVDGV